ncbi:hypothetical protein, partial [Lacticaseibacillus rhamnosus]|uniref:hypothetical protein n=1 Tax=Lacticaseibacillus rhamnosus TaxID=47715 RepID=UPI001CDC4C60
MESRLAAQSTTPSKTPAAAKHKATIATKFPVEKTPHKSNPTQHAPQKTNAKPPKKKKKKNTHTIIIIKKKKKNTQNTKKKKKHPTKQQKKPTTTTRKKP